MKSIKLLQALDAIQELIDNGYILENSIEILKNVKNNEEDRKVYELMFSSINMCSDLWKDNYPGDADSFCSKDKCIFSYGRIGCGRFSYIKSLYIKSLTKDGQNKFLDAIHTIWEFDE